MTASVKGSARAVFLDRDGVLNEVVERDGAHLSPQIIEDLRLAPDLSQLTRLRDSGFLIFMVTNQPDVARGRITMALVDEIRERIRDQVPLHDDRACFHDDVDACACRKPQPGMILELARRWHVDLDRSYFIGDMWRDVEAAAAAGVTSILLRRPYNEAVTPDVEVRTLTEAVEWILDRP